MSERRAQLGCLWKNLVLYCLGENFQGNDGSNSKYLPTMQFR